MMKIIMRPTMPQGLHIQCTHNGAQTYPADLLYVSHVSLICFIYHMFHTSHMYRIHHKYHVTRVSACAQGRCMIQLFHTLHTYSMYLYIICIRCTRLQQPYTCITHACSAPSQCMHGIGSMHTSVYVDQMACMHRREVSHTCLTNRNFKL